MRLNPIYNAIVSQRIIYFLHSERTKLNFGHQTHIINDSFHDCCGLSCFILFIQCALTFSLVNFPVPVILSFIAELRGRSLFEIIVPVFNDNDCVLHIVQPSRRMPALLLFEDPADTILWNCISSLTYFANLRKRERMLISFSLDL